MEDVTEKLSVLGDNCNRESESNSLKLSRTLTEICKAHEEKDFYERRLKKIKKILSILEKGNKSRLPRNRVKKRKKFSEVDRSTRSSQTSQVDIASKTHSITSLKVEEEDSEYESESSIESKHEFDEDFELNSDPDSDDDYVIEDKKVTAITISEKIKPNKSKKRPRKRNKNYQRKDLEYLQTRYHSTNIETSSDIESDLSSELKEENTNRTRQTKHQWYFQLSNKFTTSSFNFSNNYLVIFRGTSNGIAKCLLSDLLSKQIDDFQRNIDKVIFIQRGQYAQLYIIKELQKSLHFSLNQGASDYLLNICREKKIEYEKYQNTICCERPTIFLKNQLGHELTNDNMESVYTQKMIEMAKLYIPILLSSTTTATNRANNVLNLGITDLKVHLHKRTTITGCQGLTLISAWSKKTKIGNEALTLLGKFLMLLIKEVIPFTAFPKMFEPIHPIEKEYHELFARQLNLFEEDDLNLFNIPAVSLLINDELKPHCDSLNPIDPEGDATFSITVQVPLSDIPESITHIFGNRFRTSIPFCIVMYRRQCLANLSSHHLKIEDYLDVNGPYLEGRQ